MIDPVPGKEPVPPSPLDGLSKQELKTAALAWLGKAKDCHQRARKAEAKLAAAEAELALYRVRERQGKQ